MLPGQAPEPDGGPEEADLHRLRVAVARLRAPRIDPAAWSLRARLVAAAASGLLLNATFPPLDQGWLAYLALVPMLLAVRGAAVREPRAALREGALLGLVFGIAFLGVLLYWISYFGWVAWAALVMVQAILVALFGALGARAAARGLWSRTAGLALVWAGVEMLRGRWPLGGFTWGDVGYSQAGGGPTLPLARAGGVYLLGLALVAFNALAAEALARPRIALGVAAGLLLVVPALMPLGLAGERVADLDVFAVQANVPRGHFEGVGRRRGREGPEDFKIIQSHLNVTAGLVATQQHPGLVVWPENAFDRDPRRDPDLYRGLTDTIRAVGSPFVVGAILSDPKGFRNSNLFFDSAGELRARYDKVHLVPFGEYVPLGVFRRLVPALDREIPTDGVPGERLVVFDAGSARVGTLICFEATYPDLARGLVRAGAQVIVVSTNNASFGTSPAAQQHLAMSRMRAVEHGRAVVHSAISGISALILPDGTVTQRLEVFTQGALRDLLPLTEGRTLYTRFGGATEALMGLGALAVAVRALRRRPQAEEEGA